MNTKHVHDAHTYIQAKHKEDKINKNKLEICKTLSEHFTIGDGHTANICGEKWLHYKLSGDTELKYNETNLNKVKLKMDSRELVRMQSTSFFIVDEDVD